MRSPFSDRRTELEISLLLLGALLLFVTGGLAFEGNWAKLLRVTTAFIGYASVLLILVGRGASPRLSVFILAGAAAGLISGLVRPEPMPLLFVATQCVACAALFAPAHWLGLRYHRHLTSMRTPLQRTVAASETDPAIRA